MKLMMESKDVMKRFEMSFLNESRDCIFQEDVSQLRIAGEKVGPFKKGEQVTLPNWVIENLLKRELVYITPPKDAYESIKQLENLSRIEKKNPYKLQTFQPHLYSAIARKALLLQSDKTSIGPRKVEEIEKLRKYTYTLVETRISKILRIANSNAYQEKRNQLAHEERWLCEELVELLYRWRQNIME